MASCCFCHDSGMVRGRTFCTCFMGSLARASEDDRLSDVREDQQKFVDTKCNLPGPVTHIWRRSGYDKDECAAIFKCRLCSGTFRIGIHMLRNNRAVVLPPGKTWGDVNMQADFDLFEVLLPKGPCWPKLRKEGQS